MWANILLWLPWALRITVNLIGKMDRLKKEVPEALTSIDQCRQVIMDSLSGGINDAEAQQIKAQMARAWDQIDDVMEIFLDVIPVKRNSDEKQKKGTEGGT
ncbi:MAG: hypothetical protein FJ012_11230 [Chloroflexi bacterium]|nr:hypothetical protein [Chloroflexota bacterium]